MTCCARVCSHSSFRCVSHFGRPSNRVHHVKLRIPQILLLCFLHDMSKAAASPFSLHVAKLAFCGCQNLAWYQFITPHQHTGCASQTTPCTSRRLRCGNFVRLPSGDHGGLVSALEQGDASAAAATVLSRWLEDALLA